MVLESHGGAGTARSTTSRRLRLGDERGSQAVEFALILPALAIVFVLLVQVGALAADVVRVQQLARDAARAAVLDLPTGATADRRIAITGPGGDGLITARVELRNRSLSRFGRDVWVTGVATMTDEPAPNP